MLWREKLEHVREARRAEGRAEVQREAHRAEGRMEAARRDGAPFDEPPPFLDADGRAP